MGIDRPPVATTNAGARNSVSLLLDDEISERATSRIFVFRKMLHAAHAAFLLEHRYDVARGVLAE